MSAAVHTSEPRSPSRRRRRVRPELLVGVAVVAVLGAAAGVLASDASPTMTPAADAAYRAALVGLCALAGSRARRWTLLWSSVVVTAAAPPLQFVAAAAAVTAMGMLVLHRRHRVVGALVGAAAGLAALDLARPTRFGATALVAAIALIPLLASGLGRSSRRTRRVIGFGVLAAVLILVVAVAGAAAFAVQQRSAVESAIDETRAAVDLAGAEDSAAATDAFAGAAGSFDEISAAGDAWWLVPARVTPVLGPNLHFARAAVAAGAELNHVAGDLSASVDQEALRAPTGGIDMAVLASMQEPVAAAVEGIAAAQESLLTSDSPWLVGPLRDGLDELLDELGAAGDSALTAELAVEEVPGILGAEGPRRYLMLLGNPAEARDIGGHIGNWAEVIAENGVLTISVVGQPYDLSSPATSPPLSLTGGAYPQSLMELRPQYFPQNWGGTADFPTVARLAKELYPQSRPGHELDGVIYADPAAFAALLTFTGPQAVAGTDIVLTPQNAAQFLTSDQFSVFETESEGNAVVSGLIETVVRTFGTTQLPSPRTLTDVLGPLVRRGSLQFVSFDDADTPLLERLGLLGAVERPGSGDLLGVLSRNTNPSKIDVYLRRSTEYTVDWDPVTGDVTAHLTVTLTNDAPTTGLPAVVGNGVPGLAPGTNRTMLSVLSPWAVERATLDDAATTVGTQQELRGVRRHSVMVDLAPGTTRVVELDLAGTVGPDASYVLQWIGQTTVTPGSTSVTVRETADPLATDREVLSTTFDSSEDVFLSVDDPPA